MGKKRTAKQSLAQKEAHFKKMIAGMQESFNDAVYDLVMSALDEALHATYQDSGNAAFNWLVHINEPGAKIGADFVRVRGAPPVGNFGDARGAGHATVINAVRNNVEGLLFSEQRKGPVFRVIITNPIPINPSPTNKVSYAAAAHIIGMQRQVLSNEITRKFQQYGFVFKKKG